jgi:hypothetical protein
MLYEFKSRAAGTVVMTDAVGSQAIDILGKSGSQGIFTVAELPGAIARLQAAVAHSKTISQPTPDADTDTNESAQASVSLAARLTPLIDLMQRSLQGQKEVTWGV